MAQHEEDLPPLCYFCEKDVTEWVYWTLHEIPQTFGGGLIETEIGVCDFHAEMITETLWSIACLPDSRKVS